MLTYDDKPAGYFSRARTEISPFLPPHFRSVLEVGCGSGHTLEWLKKSDRCDQTFGIELFPAAAEAASFRANQVWQLDVERQQLPAELGQFDAILCLDVLEHMADPWMVLAKLKVHLKPGGVIISSIPNFFHGPTFGKMVLSREFRYQKEGVLDRTHLRFFSRQTVEELFKESGYRQIEVSGINSYFQAPVGSPGKLLRFMYFALTFPVLGSNSRYLQYLVRATT